LTSVAFLIPKPGTIGKSVKFFIFLIDFSSSIRFADSCPVIPVILTKYKNPLAFFNINFRRSSLVVGVISLIKSILLSFKFSISSSSSYG